MVVLCNRYIYYSKYMPKKLFTIKTKYGSFECVFEPEKDMSGYTAEVKEIPGALSWGKNFSEAKRMITEATECAIEGELIIAAKEAQDTILRKYSRIHA